MHVCNEIQNASKICPSFQGKRNMRADSERKCQWKVFPIQYHTLVGWRKDYVVSHWIIETFPFCKTFNFIFNISPICPLLTLLTDTSNMLPVEIRVRNIYWNSLKNSLLASKNHLLASKNSLSFKNTLVF